MLLIGMHPNTVYFQDAYEDEHEFHLVMELCSGGELFDQIVKQASWAPAPPPVLPQSSSPLLACGTGFCFACWSSNLHCSTASQAAICLPVAQAYHCLLQLQPAAADCTPALPAKLLITCRRNGQQSCRLTAVGTGILALWSSRNTARNNRQMLL